jgi:hypothetical protein
MLLDRLIKMSIRAEVESLLTDGTGELAEYLVYGEDELRQRNFTPPVSGSPYCFLVVSRIEPTKTQLPFIAVDLPDIGREPFELGNRFGRQGQIELHVLGRSEGEATDLASYLADGWPNSFVITNYNSYTYRGYGSGSPMGYAELTSMPRVRGPGELAEALILENSLYHWQIVSFGYQCIMKET